MNANVTLPLAGSVAVGTPARDARRNRLRSLFRELHQSDRMADILAERVLEICGEAGR